MCYKSELQQKNEMKLNRLLDAENIGAPIKRYFLDIESKSGALSYWYAIKDLMNWLIAEKIISKSALNEVTLDDFYNVEATDINTYLHYKEDSGMSPTTLQTRKQIFSSFWEYLVSNKKCNVDDNIIKRVKYKGIVKNGLIQKLPSDEQLKEMETRILGHGGKFLKTRNFAILKLFEGSGIRETELCGLDVSDLFLDADVPYIKVVGKGTYREIESRVVYLTKTAVDALMSWLQVRETKSIAEESAVFIGHNGKRINENAVRKMFNTCSDGDVTPHMVRHWYASMLYSKGLLALAQQQLGHKTVNTTINKYASGIYGARDILASM